MSPRLKNRGGHAPRVPHQIAAMVRIYLINDAIVPNADTRLRLPTEILLKGMQQEQGTWQE